MIRINLSGKARKSAKGSKAAPRERKSSLGLLPILLIGIVLGSAVGGYLWYAKLASDQTNLITDIGLLETQKAQLQREINENKKYENRKKAFENRIKVIEDLQRSKVSPVVSLDILGDALERTHWVWLTSLDQSNVTFSMSGTGTSLDALADLYSNLEATGYFRNINLLSAQAKDAEGNYSFSLTCEFSPPARTEGEGVKGN